MIFDWDAAGFQSFVADPAVPPILHEAGHVGKPQGGCARRQLPRLTSAHISEDAMTRTPIKVGQIAELTGPLSLMGQANANIVRMLVDDINAAGGLLGRDLELVVEDGATTRQRRRSGGRQARQP